MSSIRFLKSQNGKSIACSLLLIISISWALSARADAHQYLISVKWTDNTRWQGDPIPFDPSKMKMNGCTLLTMKHLAVAGVGNVGSTVDHVIVKWKSGFFFVHRHKVDLALGSIHNIHLVRVLSSRSAIYKITENDGRAYTGTVEFSGTKGYVGPVMTVTCGPHENPNSNPEFVLKTTALTLWDSDYEAFGFGGPNCYSCPGIPYWLGQRMSAIGRVVILKSLTVIRGAKAAARRAKYVAYTKTFERKSEENQHADAKLEAWAKNEHKAYEAYHAQQNNRKRRFLMSSHATAHYPMAGRYDATLMGQRTLHGRVVCQFNQSGSTVEYELPGGQSCPTNVNTASPPAGWTPGTEGSLIHSSRNSVLRTCDYRVDMEIRFVTLDSIGGICPPFHTFFVRQTHF